MCFPNLIKYLY
uniref:Uncharacterized protein n=1 Tax=Rhizophora mucronata TaxID=61149 RepID=A0A2P2NLU1_RHIMU